MSYSLCKIQQQIIFYSFYSILFYPCMLSAIFYCCHGMHFPLFVNGDNRMIVTSIRAIKEHWNLPNFFISSPICPHNFSLHTLSLYFLFDMSIIPHIYAPLLLIFRPFLKTNSQPSLQTNTRSVMEVT